jgi:hypothetical protein
MTKTIVILRTSPETIANVVAHAKYALRGELKELKPGDIMLIAQKAATVPDGKPIRYLMTFVRCYRDKNKESDRIWGRHWNYIIEGSGCYSLKTPFDIRQIQVTKKNYAQGGTVVYVDSEDAVVLEAGGYLEVKTNQVHISTTRQSTVRRPKTLKASITQDVNLLERIVELWRSGAITEEEFSILKAKILN